MEQARLIHVKPDSCPALICQCAKLQHFGSPDININMSHQSADSSFVSLPALLHRYFDLSQAGQEFDKQHNVSLWYPLLYIPNFVPLQGLARFRRTIDWLFQFPELSRTYFRTD